MWTAVTAWLAGLFRAAEPQVPNFQALGEQYRLWGQGLAAQYEALNKAQQDRVTALEAAATRYREWTETHIRRLEEAELRCRQERDAALVRINVLESKVVELEEQVRHLLAVGK